MDVKGWDLNTIKKQDFDDLTRVMSVNAENGKSKTENGVKSMSMADFVTKGVDA